MEIKDLSELEIIKDLMFVDSVKLGKNLIDYIPFFITFKEIRHLKSGKPYQRAIVFLKNKHKDIKVFPEDWDGKLLAMETVKGEYIPYFKVLKLFR